MTKNIILGKEIDIQLSKRYFQFNRGAATKDVFDAIVEMITNSDDSYHRLYSRKLRNKDGGQYLLNF